MASPKVGQSWIHRQIPDSQSEWKVVPDNACRGMVHNVGFVGPDDDDGYPIVSTCSIPPGVGWCGPIDEFLRQFERVGSAAHE